MTLLSRRKKSVGTQKAGRVVTICPSGRKLTYWYISCTSIQFITSANTIHATRGDSKTLDASLPCVRHAVAEAIDATSTHAASRFPTFEYTTIHDSKQVMRIPYTMRARYSLCAVLEANAQLTPMSVNNIPQAIPNAAGGGRTATVSPALGPTGHAYDVPNPVTTGNNVYIMSDQRTARNTSDESMIRGTRVLGPLTSHVKNRTVGSKAMAARPWWCMERRKR